MRTWRISCHHLQAWAGAYRDGRPPTACYVSQGGGLFCLCAFICQQDNLKSCRLILMTFLKGFLMHEIATAIVGGDSNTIRIQEYLWQFHHCGIGIGKLYEYYHWRPSLSIGLAVLCFFYGKQVIGLCTAKSQPIWIKFCIHLLLYGIHLLADLDRDRHTGGSRPKEIDYIFFIKLVTHNKSYIEALKILPNASKMARAGQRVDTSFSSHYHSFAKSGWERRPGQVWEVVLGFPSLGAWGALLVWAGGPCPGVLALLVAGFVHWVSI